MIIIGSYAARLNNILPSWREGQTISNDIDILLTQQEANEFKGNILYQTDFTIMTEWQQNYFDLHIVPQEMKDLASSLAFQSQSYFSYDMQLATPEIIWSSLYLTAGINAKTPEKSFKDFFFYDNLNLNITEDHKQLALMFREISVAGVKRLYTI